MKGCVHHRGLYVNHATRLTAYDIRHRGSACETQGQDLGGPYLNTPPRISQVLTNPISRPRTRKMYKRVHTHMELEQPFKRNSSLYIHIIDRAPAKEPVPVVTVPMKISD